MDQVTIWYITANNGDGSSSTHFFDSFDCIEYCCDEDNGLEEYWDGDGGSYGHFLVPIGTEISGIKIYSIDSLKAWKEY